MVHGIQLPSQIAIFAIIAVALAAPSPKPEPAPAPQYVTYSTGLDYGNPSAAYLSSVVSPYSAAAPLVYSGYPGVNALYPYY